MKRLFTVFLCCLLMASFCACGTEELKEEYRIPLEEIVYISREGTLPTPINEHPDASQRAYDLIDECSIFDKKVQLTTEQKSKEHMLLMWQKLHEETQFFKNMNPEHIIHYPQDHKILFCYLLPAEPPSDGGWLTEEIWLAIILDDQTGDLLSADPLTNTEREALKTGDGLREPF